MGGISVDVTGGKYEKGEDKYRENVKKKLGKRKDRR
jgi:hypothetical protein